MKKAFGMRSLGFLWKNEWRTLASMAISDNVSV
jgi:hypothetical protein